MDSDRLGVVAVAGAGAGGAAPWVVGCYRYKAWWPGRFITLVPDVLRADLLQLWRMLSGVLEAINTQKRKRVLHVCLAWSLNE